VLHDARTLLDGCELRAEVCIAGSGPAGITLALERGRAGVNVVVLEAGGHAVEPDAADAARAEIADGVAHDPVELASRRRLGGTSTE
jgi:2-polyprenyl-6-methoxyphenol hydroxylase-like FAD-dependent oxidoreductase